MNEVLRFLPFVFIEKNTPSVARSMDDLLGCFCGILDLWAWRAQMLTLNVSREDYDRESYVEVMA